MAKTLSKQMSIAKKKHENQLKETARKNTTATKKVAGEEPVNIKLGSPKDQVIKTQPYENARFGMSKGVTKNMDNYESLRVDVWCTDTVQDGETLSDAYERLDAILDEVLEETVLRTAGE